MKTEKLVIPALVIGAVLLIYFSYFNSGDKLGLFSEFDTNSNANREILVKILHEKGIQIDASGGASFYVEDRSGKQVPVSGSVSLPQGFESMERIILMGHYSGDSFHAHEVKIKE
ncbi:MAG: cytochrome c maturation protein CcmE [Melioribacteraceae bacterium]